MNAGSDDYLPNATRSRMHDPQHSCQNAHRLKIPVQVYHRVLLVAASDRMIHSEPQPRLFIPHVKEVLGIRTT